MRSVGDRCAIDNDCHRDSPSGGFAQSDREFRSDEERAIGDGGALFAFVGGRPLAQNKNWLDRKKQNDEKQKQRQSLPRLPKDEALRWHADAMARGADCPNCPLFGARAGPVMGDIRRNARLTIIGEAPGCFPSGTLVSTPNGFVDIDQVTVGSGVLDSNGVQTTVRKTFVRNHDAGLIDVTLVGGWQVSMTPNHPTWAYGYQRPAGRGHARRVMDVDGAWVAADTLSSQHCVFIPWPKRVGRPVTFGLSDYASRSMRNVRVLPSHVTLDEDLAFVLGLFVADGSASRDDSGVATWHLSKGYKERHVERVCRVIQAVFGLEPHVVEYGRVIAIRVYSTQLCRWLRATFYAESTDNESFEKVVPSAISNADASMRNAFIFGWHEGDGHHRRNLNKAQGVVTTSRRAALSLFDMLLSLQVYPNWRHEPPTGKGRLWTYSVQFRNSDIKRLGWNVPTHSRKSRELHTRTAEGVYVPIARVERRLWTGNVYNFETATHDYCVPFLVHNSNEVDTGRVFCGKSGDELDRALSDGGAYREECTITNTLLCRPPEEFQSYVYRLNLQYENARERWDEAVQVARSQGLPDPEMPVQPKLPTTCCAPRLKRDIEESAAPVVLAVGAPALRSVADHWNVPYGASRKIRSGEVRIATLKKQIGAPITMSDGTIVVASYHPAFAMRAGSRQYQRIVRKHIARAAAISGRKHIDWVEPQYVLDPPPRAIHDVLDTIGRYAEGNVTIDIETDKGTRPDKKFDPRTCRIRCIGVGANIDGGEKLICVPIRRIDGSEWWSDFETKKFVIQQLLTLFRTLRKRGVRLLGHNLAFDTLVLLRVGLLEHRDDIYDDTMLMHHDTISNDLPHDLGFVGAEYYEVPAWKSGADDKYYEQVTDEDLHLYNCLMSGTPVVMEDGRTELVQDLVRRKCNERVLSLSPSGQIEPRRIVGWHSQRVPKQAWWCLQTARPRASAVGLRTTPDHQIYTQRGRIRADSVRVGDDVFLPERKWSTQQRRTILGTLLGDARLAVSPTYRRRPYEAGEAYLDGAHRSSDGWAQHKARVLPSVIRLGNLIPEKQVSIRGRRTVQHEAQTYASRCSRQLGDLIPLIYDADGGRRLRLEVLEQLGPEGLAWWFVDDGCRQNGQRCRQNDGSRGGSLYAKDTVCLALQRYTRADAETATAWFVREFGTGILDGAQVLRLGTTASEKFVRFIAAFVPTSMRHKFPRHLQGLSECADTVWMETDEPVTAHIVKSCAYEPRRATKSQRYIAETRWCITVEGNHNFFTTLGLVKNCRDVLTTMRLGRDVYEEVMRCGARSQYEVDRAIAPVARDMGDLGLCIDERMRGELSTTMNAECKSRRNELVKLVGDQNFNPRSPPQIRRFLYKTKGLLPVINTKGKDWLEGEDPATNINALLKLKATQALDRTTSDFIETLLEFRAYEKLRGTYIDNLEVSPFDFSKYGYEVGTAPPVIGEVYTKYKRSDQLELLGYDRRSWRGISSFERERALSACADGRYTDAEVIPLRSALSRLYTVYKIHVIPSGRMSTQPACFDAETEILTRRGWVKFPALRDDDDVAQYWWDSEEIDFVRPTARIDRSDYTELVLAHGQRFEFATTTDHRFTAKTRKQGVAREYRADDLPNSQECRIPIGGYYHAGTERIDTRLLSFVAAAQADGYVNKGGNWEFSFSKERKVSKLRALLLALNYEFTERPKRNGVYTQTRFVVHRQHTAWTEEFLTRTRPLDGGPETKLFNVERFMRLSQGCLAFMRDEVLTWDGCVTRESMYSCSEKHNTDFVQMLYVLTGMSAKVRAYENDGTTRTNWQVDRYVNRWTSPFGVRARVPYRGRVYCVTVPSDMVVTRRNGRVAITNNCQNWPEQGKSNMRKMVVAPPGHVFVGADFDQIELRLYAAIAGDRLLLEAFNTPCWVTGEPAMDPHAWNAACLFAEDDRIDTVRSKYAWIRRLPEMMRDERIERIRTYECREPTKVEVEEAYQAGEKERKKYRNIAKRFVYLELYGGEEDKLFSVMSSDRDKATGKLMFPDLKPQMVERWHKMWHTLHPETKQWQLICQRAARLEGYTAAPLLGYRKRWFSGGANKPGATFNHVIQSAAGEVANRALLLIAERIPYGCWSPFTGLCLQVHDYIGVCVPIEKAELAKRIIEEAMAFQFSGMKFTATGKISHRTEKSGYESRWSDQ